MQFISLSHRNAVYYYFLQCIWKRGWDFIGGLLRAINSLYLLKIIAPFQKNSVYVTEFAIRGLIHAITNIEKSRFEILNTVYLENAWCLVYEILHQSIVIYKVIQLVFSWMAC